MPCCLATAALLGSWPADAYGLPQAGDAVGWKRRQCAHLFSWPSSVRSIDLTPL